MSSSRSSSARSSSVSPRRGGADVLADRDAAADEHVLERSVAREAVDLGAQAARVDVLAADGGGDDLGEGGGERGHRAGRADLERPADERLVADEDVEALDQVALELLPRAVGDLHPGEVRGALAQPLDDGGRDCVAARDRELVDVERERRAGGGSGGEVLELRALVERRSTAARSRRPRRRRPRRRGRRARRCRRSTARRRGRRPAGARRTPRGRARPRASARGSRAGFPRRSSRARAARRGRRRAGSRRPGRSRPRRGLRRRRSAA